MINRFDKSWKYYSVILLVQAYYSLKIWFLWWLPDFSAALTFGTISAFYFVSKANFWNFKDNRRICIAILLALLFLYKTEGNILAYIFSIISVLPLVSLVFLKSELLGDILDKFQKTIVPILSISLAFWIGHLLAIDLPSFEMTYGQIDRGYGLETQYYFDNHFFYLVDQSWFFRDGLVPGFFRFSSIFLEPGYLAILMVFLLFINKFNFKDRRNILYITVIIATVSLAGFLMGVFAFAAHSVQHTKRGVFGLMIGVIIIFWGYDFFQEYNNGDNFVNEGIIERLQYDRLEGTISGNNRTSQALDLQFEKFLVSSDVFWGLGAHSDLEFGVGYKRFLMRYGIMGLALFLTYMMMIARIGKNYRANILFVLYVLMFIRGDVTMFWHGFMLVYIAGVIHTKIELINEKNSTRLTVQRI